MARRCQRGGFTHLPVELAVTAAPDSAGQPDPGGVAWCLLPLVWPLEGGIIPIAHFLDDRGP
jgi:hypothetical protein